jgi:CelD/BcsL family acetyltransferase involved in cellulose biosynthesis
LIEDLSVESISRFEEFLSLKSDWNELLDHNEFNSVFLSHGWFKCFWDAWGKGRRLRVLVARKGAQLLGVAPLMLYKGQFLDLPVKILSFIENDESPHCGFVIRKNLNHNVIAAFFDFICSNLNRWDILVLRKVPVEASIVELIKPCCQQNGYRFVVKTSLRSPVLSINSDWDSFYSNKSQRFKKTVRHARNKLARRGNIVVEESHDPGVVTRLLDQIFDIGARSWKARVDNAIGSSMQNRVFFSELPLALNQRGQIWVWSLKLNDRIVAFEYHVRQGEIVYALRASFDEAYRACGPGSVLDVEVVRGLFKRKVKLYNMCGGPYAHKLRWASEVKSHVDIVVFNRRPYAGFLYFLEKGFKPIIKRILKLNNHSLPFGRVSA